MAKTIITKWTIVTRDLGGRFFRPVTGAIVGTWDDSRKAADKLIVPIGTQIYNVPAQGQTDPSDDDHDNVLTAAGTRIPIRWDAAPKYAMPAAPTETTREEPDMAKRGQRQTHRVHFTHANGLQGTIVARDLDDALDRARVPMSRAGCVVTLVEVTDTGRRRQLAYLDDPGAVELARDAIESARLARISAAR